MQFFFVLANGFELGDAGSGDNGLRERQKAIVEELHRRERNLILSNMNLESQTHQNRRNGETLKFLRVKGSF